MIDTMGNEVAGYIPYPYNHTRKRTKNLVRSCFLAPSNNKYRNHQPSTERNSAGQRRVQRAALAYAAMQARIDADLAEAQRQSLEDVGWDLGESL